MRLLILFLTLVVLQGTMVSCLVPPGPLHHSFRASASSSSENYPDLKIFSTPRLKQYLIESTDTTTRFYIQSPVFDHPDSFYLMTDQDVHGQKVKAFTENICMNKLCYRSEAAGTQLPFPTNQTACELVKKYPITAIVALE